MTTQQSTEILLVYVDPVLFPFAQPYGPLIIQGHLKAKGLSSSVLLPFQAQDPATRLKRALEIEQPRIVGFSFRNFDSAGLGRGEEAHTHLPSLEMLVDVCRHTLPQTLTILGGGGFSTDPVSILEATRAHLGFVGPAENEFVAFCAEYLTTPVGQVVDASEIASRFPSSIINTHGQLLRREHSKGRLNWLSNEYLPYEFHDEAVDFGEITGGSFPVRTKTGCSMACSYCVIPQIEPLSLRPILHVIQDITSLSKRGLGDRIFIADGEFNLPNQDRCLHICRAIKSSFNQEIKWRCYVCPSEVSESLPDEMFSAGCVGAGLAVDSFSDPVRRGMGKRGDSHTAITSVEMFLASGIETSFTLLFGAPGESLETLRHSARIARKLVEMGAHVSLTAGIVIYPGTPLSLQIKDGDNALYVWNSAHKAARPTFCSPASPDHVYGVLKEEFHGLDRVHWTSQVTDRNRDFFQALANTLCLVYEGRPQEAIDALETGEWVRDANPNCMLLKAKAMRSCGRSVEAQEVLAGIIKSQAVKREQPK